MNVIKKEFLKVVTGNFTNQQGEQKNVYKTIGELTTFQDQNGNTFQGAEIYHMPGVRVKVFEAEQKQAPQQAPQQATSQAPQQATSQAPSEDDVETQNIPF
jgi:hypothetical protein